MCGLEERQKRKRRKIFGEGKEIFAEEKDGERKAGKYFMRRSKKIEKEKEENICKRKIIFALESHNREGNGGKISWRRKYCCGRVDGRTSKALKEVLGHLKVLKL